jgi:dual specificity tyrosine-phosphorylation-regulated kinase 2/3/4
VCRPSLFFARRRACLVAEAVTLYGNKLTTFEKTEIFDYNEIYFVGLEAEKIAGSDAKDYDDENGSFIKISKDHICYRFEVLETLGKGSFGLVLRCFDHKKKETVALKIIRNKKRFQQQGLVEVNILTHLKNLDVDNTLNIVHIKEHFYFRSHLCITFELLG